MVPATLADARAFRIFNLIDQGVSLSDAESLVASIFKVPTATAKRLVNSAVARYAVELQQGLSGTIADVLDAATWDGEHARWEVRMPTTFIRERILEVAARQPVPDPSRAAGSLLAVPRRDLPSGPEGVRTQRESGEMTLDEEISSGFSLLGLLLVFVIGYFAAFFPLTQEILERPAPDVAAGRRALATKIRTYRVLLGGVLVLTIATGIVVAP